MHIEAISKQEEFNADPYFNWKIIPFLKPVQSERQSRRTNGSSHSSYIHEIKLFLN